MAILISDYSSQIINFVALKKIEIMFEGLSERLDRSFKLLKGQGYITEINVAETLKDVRKALLDAGVALK